MLNTNQKKQGDNKNTIDPVVAGIAKAVAIAGVAVAIALKDKKTREKIKKSFISIKDQAIDYVKTLEIETKKGG